MSITTTINRPLPDPAKAAPHDYWEARAQRFAASGAGLAAVCSYGMPAFYNRYIDLVQHRALRDVLRRVRGKRVLDLGCGVGRWSRRLAAAGARVTGADVSPTMIAEAQRRAIGDGFGEDACRFVVADVVDLHLDERFDLILAVTVLQHLKEMPRLDAALKVLTNHVSRDGEVALLEVAPTKPLSRCDSDVFVARTESQYLAAFERAGLHCRGIAGVDPAPFKTWLLPSYRRMSDAAAIGALAAVTGASAAFDLVCASWLPRSSWHKLFLLERAR